MGECYILFVHRGIEVWSFVNPHVGLVRSHLTHVLDEVIEETSSWLSGVQFITLDRKGTLVVVPRNPMVQLPYVKQISTGDLHLLLQVP